MNPFASVCAVGFLARLSYAMARNPALPLFAATFTGSDRAVGFAAAASTITGIVFKLPAGALSDIVGRRALLTASMLLFAGMPFAYFLVGSYKGLVAVRFIHGLATALYGPVAMAFVTDLAGEKRGARLAWFTTLTAIGSLCAPLVSGLILDRTPGRPFMNVFLVAGFVGGLALLLTLVVIARRATVATERRTFGEACARFGRGLREVVSDRRVLATSGAEAAIMFASNALAVFLALYVTEILEKGKWFAGLLLTVQIVANLAARPLLGEMGDRIGRKPLVLIGLVLSSVPLVVIWMVRAPWLVLPLMIVFGLGESLVGAATAALVADVCRAQNYGAAMGTFGTIFDAGEASGPIVVGLLKDYFGRRVLYEHFAYFFAFAPVAALLIVAALGFALLVREPERPIS
jgi:MFS family permease